MAAKGAHKPAKVRGNPGKDAISVELGCNRLGDGSALA